MKRPDSFPREEFNRLRRHWVARHRWLISAIALLAILFVIGQGAWIVAGGAGSLTAYIVGITSGLILAIVPFVLTVAFLIHERTSIWQLRGAWGEENTRDVLAQARRRRKILGWVDSLTLQHGDLDHLVLTRSGEFILIDSKWRSAGGLESAAEMARSCQRGRVRAEGVLRSVLNPERGSHRAKGSGTPVTAIIAIWGTAQSELPPGATIDGIEFVGGRDLRR